MTGLDQGVGFDLELDGKSRLRTLGAVLGLSELRSPDSGPPEAALRALDSFAAPAAFTFGHNIYWHDLPHLARLAPTLGLLRKPAVDTLVVSAIAFADHPYHALIKDYKLVKSTTNDPVADCRIAAQILADSRAKLGDLFAANPTRGRVLRSLSRLAMRAVGAQARDGMELLLAGLTPPSDDLDADLRLLVAPHACTTALRVMGPIAQIPAESQLALLFAVAWLRVSATHDQTSASVVMPWVRRQFPKVTEILSALRDRPCAAEDCSWCRLTHDPVAQLQRWFQYPDFRPLPSLEDGQGAQRAIVEAGFADRSLLALLPTGGGKSLCFQLPAIHRYLRRGSLTVVICPLQSLMHDQVENFAMKTGVQCAFALTGQLTVLDRRDALDAVRMGRAGILYVSPEQLRNSTFRKAISMREIGAWVFDEAHCLSKWGHDFRPDYLYAARFIREFSDEQHVAIAPIVCVTATAKPEVRQEILEHFQQELGQALQVFDGHAPRENLTLRIECMPPHAKVQRMCELVATQLAIDPSGSILVYAATRGNTEKTATLLTAAGIPAEAYHAGLEVPQKKDVQKRFLDDSCRVVCATNAFGMGIDKPNIRLVVHYDMPGSLEAYVQEVGRAGRDGKPAEAVLLFAEEDIETQFRLATSSRLSLKDLQGILRRIRFLSRARREDGSPEAICTAGEILRDEVLAETLEPTDRSSPTKVVTAIAWLERGKFLSRDQNSTAIIQGRPLVKTLAEAEQRIAALNLPPHRARAWTAVLAQLIAAEADQGFSTDDFLAMPEVVGIVGTLGAANAHKPVLGMLREMQAARLLSTRVEMTAFLWRGGETPSSARLQQATRVESLLLDHLREVEPDPDNHQYYPLRLQSLTQHLVAQVPAVTLDLVRSILSCMSDRASSAGPRAPGLRVTFTSHDRCMVLVKGSWDQVANTSRRRHAVAGVCLQVMLKHLTDTKASDRSLLASFSLENLLEALDKDLELRSQPSPDPASEIEYALLFLHRIGAIVLHKGMAVFRQAMVLRIEAAAKGRKVTKAEFAPLAKHQEQRTVQIHVMHEFVRRMTEDPLHGLRLLDDYFVMPEPQFLNTWFQGREAELRRPTGSESWQHIVEDLSKEQRDIVTAGDEKSLLVLAGPGSGKTRVVVHRCAYLLRVQRVPARAILVLCYNRSAAIELRRRLRDLAGEDAQGVLIQTYHGMAARLVGRSPADLLENATDHENAFREIILAATAQLAPGNAKQEPQEDDTGREELRDRLLAGFRHILVDEYQDIDEDQYQLVSAIAGRKLHDDERKLTVLAVGDDDQNIYAFRGSSVRFLRQFEDDYSAKRLHLIDNYRSTANIITIANALISSNYDRLKSDAPIRIDARRRKTDPGGRLAALDPVGKGRVHVLQLHHQDDQAEAVRAELRRLAACDPEFAWEQCAVLSARHHLLDPVRTVLERDGIPVRYRVDSKKAYSLYRLREIQEFLAAIDAVRSDLIDHQGLRSILEQQRERRPQELAVRLVEQCVTAFIDEHGTEPVARHLVREFFGETLMDQRRERTVGHGVLIGTVHGSKGAEHEHVFLLDGGWHPREADAWEERRRLYYVGMTRARQSLTLLQYPHGGAPWVPSLGGEAIIRSSVGPLSPHTEPLDLNYTLLSTKEVWLAFAGRDEAHARIRAATERLVTGAPLRIASRGNRLFLLNEAGHQVGALSKEATAFWQTRLEGIRAVRVAAVLTRTQAEDGGDYQRSLRCAEWHVVIPEITHVADSRRR